MKVITTTATIQAAFTLWMKRYEANPEDFAEKNRLRFNLEAESYGEAVTPYFLELLEEFK